MNLNITVAHDFTCPWCYVSIFQVKRLIAEFGVTVDWVGYELWPEELEFSTPGTPPIPIPNKPIVPTRLELMLAAEGLTIPKIERPKQMRVHNAMQAIEYAKTEGKQHEAIEVLYRAFWEQGININETQVLIELLSPVLKEVSALEKAISKKKFAKNIVPFDDEAYAAGVFNVPTYFINGERYAEQPYSVLAEVVRGAIGFGAGNIYRDLDFPLASDDRPYVFVNMVTTIDGKIVTGERDEPVSDLGSDVDHALMKRLGDQADGVLVGAATLRASGLVWNPSMDVRVVVTASGNVPADAAFMKNGTPIIICPKKANVKVDKPAVTLSTGKDEVDFTEAFKKLRQKFGVTNLYVLGGAEINAQLLALDLVDELFLTIAPKIKLGRDVPTYADGDPLPRALVQKYELIESHVVGDEIFARYRRRKA